MAGSTVLNRFEQPIDAARKDNKLVLEGTVETGGGVSVKEKLLTASVLVLDTQETNLFSPGFAGTVTRISVTNQSGATTGDETFTASISGTAITGGVAVIPGTSAANTVVTVTPTALNTFAATDNISIVNDGNSTGGEAGGVTIAVVPD